MTESKENVLVVNKFHQETLAILDARYATHHLWQQAESEKPGFIAALEGKCRAAASASWTCDPIVYQLNSLEVIAAFGVGVDGIDFFQTLKNAIRVTNTPGVLDDAVADLAIALLLATTRNLINAERFARNGEWTQGAFGFSTGLAGKTLGIVGLGRIGAAIAARAQPFKLRIAYHNRKKIGKAIAGRARLSNLNIAYHYRNKKDLPWQYYPSIEELAEHSDFLLCMLPGGRATDNLIDANVLKNLGPNGVFINVGRGNSVDENALAEALGNGTIKAAGLDVYKDEPHIPQALRSLDNVVLLPHIGSATEETRRAMGKLVLDNLAAFFAGQHLISEV